MIGYFTKSGDTQVSSIFGPYRQVFRDLLKARFEGRNYGQGLDLLLIQYHLEGENLKPPDKQYKLLPYRKKEHSVSVVVRVSREFGNMTDTAKRQFIIDTTLESVRLVHEKMLRLGFTDIDFKSLLADIKKSAEEYLRLPEVKYIYPREDQP